MVKRRLTTKTSYERYIPFKNGNGYPGGHFRREIRFSHSVTVCPVRVTRAHDPTINSRVSVRSQSGHSQVTVRSQSGHMFPYENRKRENHHQKILNYIRITSVPACTRMRK